MQIGSRIGAYEVIAKLGEGGMGEVYRARDTRLNRDVALKILPEPLAADSDRVARFTREAQTLAALNHPHIAQLYGVEDADGRRALVMELVEGETLAERLAPGPLPVDEALATARQILDGLEAAHEAGVIHRDLKPANIKLRPDGTVKVLDFGLAKALDRGANGSAAAPLNSPTITNPALTNAGVILGTAAYMSPEQAKGRAADGRSDVWAFGCVLYEMLTGLRAFGGEDVSDTLAAVLRGAPEWERLPADLPAHIAPIVKRCLERDRSTRMPNVSAIRFLLDEPIAPSAAQPSSTTGHAGARRSLWRWRIAAALLALSTLGAGIAWYVGRSMEPQVVRFFVQPPENTEFTSGTPLGASAVISPDGTKLAFTARDNTGRTQLWIRALDATAPQLIPGTTGAVWPFWSPDSRFVAYFSTGSLMKASTL